MPKLRQNKTLLLLLLFGLFISLLGKATVVAQTLSLSTSFSTSTSTSTPTSTSTIIATPSVPAQTSSKIRFPANAPRPLKIGVAITLNDVIKINEQAGTYEASVDIRLRWRDSGLAFDQKVVGVDRQEFGGEDVKPKLASIWSPELTIANMPDKPSTTESGIFIYSDGTVIYIQRLKAVFQSSFNFKAFPFDSQLLTIRLVSTKYSANQIIFLQDQKDIDLSGIRQGARISGWELKNIDFLSSTLRCWNGDFCPQFDAKIMVTRDPFSYVAVIFVPYFLIIVVPIIMTLYIKTEMSSSLGAWSNAILALVALEFTFSVSFPSAGSGSFLAQLMTIGFAFQLLMICLTITIFNPEVTQRIASKGVIEELTSFLKWSIPLGLLGLILSRIFLTIYT